jgi:CsoR family transcriptional regulator, copper-sensing transcriptional repressor
MAAPTVASVGVFTIGTTRAQRSCGFTFLSCRRRLGGRGTLPPPGILDGVHGYTQNKDAYLKRLRRIEGQVRGIARMVEDDKYCIDILTQVSAATKALQSVALGLLDEHMASCVVDAARAGGAEADAKVKEASDAIARLVRS